MSDLPQPDRIEGAPHPRETERLLGQKDAEKALLSALFSERMPHAWLLTGPQGVGKATFAYLASRAILSGTADTLTHDAKIAAHARVAAGNEMAVRTLTRTVNEKTGKLRSQIAVEDVRALKRALTLGTTDRSWRIVIVDPAEDMNASAANALLKVLEEPPARVVFFLVSHAPGRLLPTIRSRCRRLDFAPLDEAALAEAYEQATGEPPSPTLVQAARGSAGNALGLAAQDGSSLQDGIARVLAPLPDRIDRAALHELADTAAASGKDEAFRTTTRLLADLTARMATASAGADPAPEGYEALIAAPTAWAETTEAVTESAERTLALNLDRRQAMLDMFAQVERVARQA